MIIKSLKTLSTSIQSYWRFTDSKCKSLSEGIIRNQQHWRKWHKYKAGEVLTFVYGGETCDCFLQ